MTNSKLTRFLLSFGTALALSAQAELVSAQWSQVYEQFYLPARHNWVFRDNYPGADRLFNAFDYGHAILYETLYRHPTAPASRLEEKEYDFITGKLLLQPPRVPLEEGAIEIAYARLAPEAKAMFEWAHILHRQIYDVLGDERLSDAQKDAAVAELLRYYKTRPEFAFSSTPKSMDIMDGHAYSGEFRQKYPKFNGLIWAYHWLQVGLYEPLLAGTSLAERQSGVAATVTRFRQMLEAPPNTMPYLMPMTAAVAPRFAARYEEASIIFDNLHMMHDVISDILTTSKIPRSGKRAEILRIAEQFRDRTSYAVTAQAWKEMAVGMGAHNMGGPTVGFLPELPQPTVERGALMAGMDHANMASPQRGATPDAHAQHGAAPARADSAKAAAADHANMPGMTGARDTATLSMQHMQQVFERMMADPVIRERVATDPVLRELLARGGMAMDSAAHHGASPAASAAAKETMDFVVRLLSDPQIEARIKSDPQLRKLYDDAAVQRCLAEMRKLKAAGQPLPAACPLTTAPPAHRH